MDDYNEHGLADCFNRLSAALQAIDTRSVPNELATPHIEYDGPGFLERNLPEIPRIYGYNTLPGHRVDEDVPKEDMVKFQFNLIANHNLGSGLLLDDRTARAVTYAKLYAASSGHTLISRDLFDEMLKAATSDSFKPKIPAHASYSAGDVIPAAHWAQELLDWEKKKEHKDPQLLPGEGMALINGGFVHVGVTLSLIRDLRDFWGLYIDTAEQSFTLLGADTRVFEEPSTPNASWFKDTIHHVKENMGNRERTSDVQDPVSIRSFPQQLQAAMFAVEGLLRETNAVLGKPSGNPVMNRDSDGNLNITPSGSFDQPALALATSNVIEALLMLAWNSVRRTDHLLKGNGGLPKDGATDDDHLAMIQWPKLAQASLERIRGKYGMHNFTSGSSTSDDIEDFWTNGTELSLSARELVGEVEKILMIERLTGERLNKVLANDKSADKITPKNIDDKTIAKTKHKIDYDSIPFPIKLSPHVWTKKNRLG